MRTAPAFGEISALHHGTGSAGARARVVAARALESRAFRAAGPEALRGAFAELGPRELRSTPIGAAAELVPLRAGATPARAEALARPVLHAMSDGVAHVLADAFLGAGRQVPEALACFTEAALEHLAAVGGHVLDAVAQTLAPFGAGRLSAFARGAIPPSLRTIVGARAGALAAIRALRARAFRPLFAHLFPGSAVLIPVLRDGVPGEGQQRRDDAHPNQHVHVKLPLFMRARTTPSHAAPNAGCAPVLPARPRSA